MLSTFKKFFDAKLAPAESETDDAARIQVATCALLLEVAHADDEFTPDEEETLSRIVQARFDLTPEQTGELLTVAEDERRGSGDLYQFARLINETFSKPRKMAILELLWQVVYSDGVLEAHEDNLMHPLGKILGIRLEELMALKLRVKKSLDP